MARRQAAEALWQWKHDRFGHLKTWYKTNMGTVPTFLSVLLRSLRVLLHLLENLRHDRVVENGLLDTAEIGRSDSITQPRALLHHRVCTRARTASESASGKHCTQLLPRGPKRQLAGGAVLARINSHLHKLSHADARWERGS